MVDRNLWWTDFRRNPIKLKKKANFIFCRVVLSSSSSSSSFVLSFWSEFFYHSILATRQKAFSSEPLLHIMKLLLHRYQISLPCHVRKRSENTFLLSREKASREPKGRAWKLNKFPQCLPVLSEETLSKYKEKCCLHSERLRRLGTVKTKMKWGPLA